MEVRITLPPKPPRVTDGVRCDSKYVSYLIRSTIIYVLLLVWRPMTSYVEMYQDNPGINIDRREQFWVRPGSVTGKLRTGRRDFYFTQVNDSPTDVWITTSNGRRTGDVADNMTSPSDVTLKRRKPSDRLTGMIPKFDPGQPL